MLPAAPPRALPRVELMMSTLPSQERCSSVPLEGRGGRKRRERERERRKSREGREIERRETERQRDREFNFDYNITHYTHI